MSTKFGLILISLKTKRKNIWTQRIHKNRATVTSRPYVLNWFMACGHQWANFEIYVYSFLRYQDCFHLIPAHTCLFTSSPRFGIPFPELTTGPVSLWPSNSKQWPVKVKICLLKKLIQINSESDYGTRMVSTTDDGPQVNRHIPFHSCLLFSEILVICSI